MTDMSTDLLHLNQATCSTSSVRRATAYGGPVDSGCRRLLAGAGAPDDTGAADPALAAALAAYAEDPAREPEVLAALADARLLVPVVAELGESETGPDGLARDKSSDMATVLMRGPDGRLALLAFTGLEAMQRWDPDARPVPVPARTAALAALQDGAEALLIDLAGPVRYLAPIGSAAGIVGYHRPLTDLVPPEHRSQAETATSSPHPHRPPCTTGRRVRSWWLVHVCPAIRGRTDGQRLASACNAEAFCICRASGPSHRNAGGHISTELRINDRIRVPEVRLVGPNGETVGIVPTDQALKLAQEADLDLVEIAPQGKPPVCKLMDYGKFKYENAQKAREARRNQTNVIIKEMKLRPKIDEHDYETKKGHVVRFLKAGDKVKITIMFRGREQHRPELGFRLLQRLAEDVTELGFVESAPKQDGRNMIMVLGPHKKKAEAKVEQQAAKEERMAERAAEAAEEAAERATARAAGPVAQKKERGRSENLDPEIEA